jgi:hypothetical protein
MVLTLNKLSLAAGVSLAAVPIALALHVIGLTLVPFTPHGFAVLTYLGSTGTLLAILADDDEEVVFVVPRAAPPDSFASLASAAQSYAHPRFRNAEFDRCRLGLSVHPRVGVTPHLRPSRRV